MSFSKKKKKQSIDYNYSLGNTVLAKCFVVKDLGVLFDSKLSFSAHITTITAAAYKMLGFVIRNTKHFSDLHAMSSLFNAFVRSKLEYASVVWCPGYDYLADCIEAVQRRFLKHLCYKLDGVYPERGSSQSNLLARFDRQELCIRRNLANALLLYKLINNFLDCPYLLCCVNFHVTCVNTRTKNTFYLPMPHSNVLIFSPIFRMCLTYLQYQDKFDIFSCTVQQIKNAVLDKPLVRANPVL